MKHILLILFIAPTLAFTQSISRDVVSAAGDEFIAATGSLSWTLGETVTETFVTDSYTLSQGFQQGDLSVTSILDPTIAGFNVNVYPNPVKNRLTINTDLQGAKYSIVNMKGKIVNTGKLNQSALQIDFTALPAGTYLLQVNKQNTHKIIKQ